MGDVEYNLFGEESLNVLVDSLKYTKNLQILDLCKYLVKSDIKIN